MNEQRENILAQIRATLVDLFELDGSEIVPEARLYEDLDIDSIDAVDLLVDLKKTISVEITPSQFKQVRTIQDVVDVFAELSAKAQAKA
ncbi:acyl carrier protein [Alteromonas ponticola]|uniref:Acyl carrier protein n=1 Tax=Alteromonas aquimaris TaxID=2998417 RepID=A0ABT3PA26_9ALTE|nr:acyl carrier protein [Alteromonas aquimaris]MCW8108916.1 acyl carrier protein [Alteromonas aquimaris]